MKMPKIIRDEKLKRINLRVTPDMYAMLETKAQLESMTISEYIRYTLRTKWGFFPKNHKTYDT